MMKWKTFSGEKAGDAAAIDNVEQRRGKLCVCVGEIFVVLHRSISHWPTLFPITFLLRLLLPQHGHFFLHLNGAARKQQELNCHSQHMQRVLYVYFMMIMRRAKCTSGAREKMKLRGKREKIFRSLKKWKTAFVSCFPSEDEKCFSFISRRSNFSFYIFHHASAAWRGNPWKISC